MSVHSYYNMNISIQSHHRAAKETDLDMLVRPDNSASTKPPRRGQRFQQGRQSNSVDMVDPICHVDRCPHTGAGMRT
jgi:hypothetical protein